jgi:hypothetical protein
MVRQWAQKDLKVKLREWRQWTGHQVLAISVGNPDADARLLVTVPHAHEPAGTAACVDVLCQLITGTHLDGTKADLPVETINQRLFITFVPDSNPQGRSRSPERVWDGIRYDNETS